MPDPDNETEEQPALEAPVRKAPPSPGLVVIWSSGEPCCVVHPLSAGRKMVVGRESAIAVDDKTVSRAHFEVTRDGSFWRVRDLGSRSPTHIDRQPLAGEVVRQNIRVLRAGTTLLLPVTDVAPWSKFGVRVDNGYALGPAQQRAYANAHAGISEGETVLILGETGTGKERLATSCHEHREKRSGRLVVVNCAQLNKELADALLFGNVKGAYSGAHESRDGYFGTAEGGTLYLDEVAELPLEVQAKLLRAIELKEVQPVGAARSRRIDVAIVAATHPNLLDAVREGRFRKDLYARFSQCEVRLPPLRERPEEIGFIAHALADGMPIATSAIELLLFEPWPLNVRDLVKRIRGAKKLVKEDEREGIAADDVVAPETAQPETAPPEPQALPVEPKAPEKTAMADAVNSVRYDLIVETLKTEGSVAAAARKLGVGRQTLYDAMVRLGIKKPRG